MTVVHDQLTSVLQTDEQPSPFNVFPSSQFSLAVMTMLPHCSEQIDGVNSEPDVHE